MLYEQATAVGRLNLTCSHTTFATTSYGVKNRKSIARRDTDLGSITQIRRCVATTVSLDRG